jgi:hypothetical protein
MGLTASRMLLGSARALSPLSNGDFPLSLPCLAQCQGTALPLCLMQKFHQDFTLVAISDIIIREFLHKAVCTLLMLLLPGQGRPCWKHELYAASESRE